MWSPAELQGRKAVERQTDGFCSFLNLQERRGLVGIQPDLCFWAGSLEGIHKGHQVQLLDLYRTPQESHPVPKSADQTFLEPWQSWDRPIPWGACFPCGGSEQDITGMRLAQLVEHDADNTKIMDLTAVCVIHLSE